MGVYRITSHGYHGKKFVRRTEYVDTSKNRLFAGAKNSSDVENAYRSFWGDEVVAVSAEPSRVKSRGENWGIHMVNLSMPREKPSKKKMKRL